MHRSVTSRYCWLALKATSALALAVAPYQFAFHGAAPGIVAASAYAKDGGGHGGSGGGGNGGMGGSGNGGSNSGRGGGDDGAGDDHGGANSGHGNGDDDGGAGHHVDAATGNKVEVDGNNIEVRHPDGTREEIENGRFEMKDAQGRTIVERPATANDISRLQAL